MPRRRSPSEKRKLAQQADGTLLADVVDDGSGLIKASVPTIPEGLSTTPWEHWPDESSKAYRAFLVYRDLGVDRSLRKAAMVLHNSYPGMPENEKMSKLPKQIPTQIQQWASRFSWVMRVEAWDEFMFREQEREWIQRRERLRNAEWNASEKLFDLGMKALKELDEGAISAEDVVRLLRLASDLGSRTKQEPVSADSLRAFLNALPIQLRDNIVGLLRGPQ